MREKVPFSIVVLIAATPQTVFTELPRSDEHRRLPRGPRGGGAAAPEAVLDELPGLLAAAKEATAPTASPQRQALLHELPGLRGAPGDDAANPKGQALLHELPRHAGRPGQRLLGRRRISRPTAEEEDDAGRFLDQSQRIRAARQQAVLDELHGLQEQLGGRRRRREGEEGGEAQVGEEALHHEFPRHDTGAERAEQQRRG